MGCEVYKALLSTTYDHLPVDDNSMHPTTFIRHDVDLKMQARDCEQARSTTFYKN